VVAFAGYGSLTDLTLRHWWIDRVAHFSGGFWAALLLIYLFRHYSELAPFSGFLTSRILTAIFAIAVAALIGTLWELFEFSVDNIGDLADTMEDLFLDLAGGGLAAICGFFYRK